MGADSENNRFPDVMTVKEAEEYLRIPQSSIYKLAQDGRIPCQKVGRHWRFRRDALDTWLAGGLAPQQRQGGSASQ
jgi:excisionase family DNA binding protein